MTGGAAKKPLRSNVQNAGYFLDKSSKMYSADPCIASFFVQNNGKLIDNLLTCDYNKDCESGGHAAWIKRPVLQQEEENMEGYL